MKYIGKLLLIGILAFVMLFSAVGVSAAEKGDYVPMEYASVEDVGPNQISITGKGIFAIKPGSNVAQSNAVIFRDTVDPRNFEVVFKFDKDYSNGGGYNDGWYSVNFSRSPEWFSSVKSVIKSNDIYGLNVTLKLDAMNKKKVFIQPSRYSPSSGFVYLLNGTWVEINKEWECTFAIKDGKMYLDDTFITDPSDALAIALPDNKAFVGFGGFSENFYDVGMTVTYSGTVQRDDYARFGASDSQGNAPQDGYIEVDITGYVIAGAVALAVVAGIIVLMVVKKKQRGAKGGSKE